MLTFVIVVVAALFAAVVELWRRLQVTAARLAALEDFQRAMAKSAAGVAALRQDVLVAEAQQRQANERAG